MAVFLLAHACFKASEAPEFAFDGHTDPMSHLAHLRGDADVVVVIGGGFAIALQRAVHHHTVIADTDRAGAGLLIISVVLMQTNRDGGVLSFQTFDKLAEKEVARIGARAAARLDDDRAVCLPCRFEDGDPLLHIVDVESGHAVAVLGSVIEKLS